MTQNPKWPALSAYVDGELEASEAAGVAEAAGNDPATAEQISALYQLKGATHAAFAEPGVDLENLVPRAPQRRTWAVQAAAAVMLIAVLAAGWLWLRPEEGVLPADLLATARTLHAEWLDAENTGVADDPPATLVAAAARFRPLPVIPDLESSKLYLDRVSFADWSGGHVLQVGYRGMHGCHLSFFVFSNAEMPETLTRLDVGSERFYGWRVGGLGYLLFAQGMDGSRMELIAHKVEEEARNRAPFDESTREALAENKRNSASCAA